MVTNVTALLQNVGAVRPPVITITWARGADGSIVATLLDENGTAVGLAGGKVELGLRTSDTAASPLFVRLAVLTDPIHGVCAVVLTASDTGTLSTGRYRYDIWFTAADGTRHQIVGASDFVVTEADTRPGEGSGSTSPVSPLSGAVDTVNTTGTALAAVGSSQLTDGFVIWVRDSGGGVGSYWHIEIGKAYPLSSTVIAAAGLAGGQWVKGLGSSVGVGLVIENIGGEYGSTNLVGEEDVIPDPRYFDFSDLATATSIVAKLLATARVTGGTGTFRVRIGGTLGAADGTVIATGTRTATSYGAIELVGSSFAKPVGEQLMQITAQNDTVGQTSWIKGASIALLPT